MKPTSAQDSIIQEIKINASAERVFEALTVPEQRIQWWSTPRSGSPSPIMESNLRPGGKWEMRFEAWGRSSSVRGEYLTIERPHLLVFTWLPDWYEDATESIVRFELSEEAGVTTVRITHSGLATERDRTNNRGWADILASLQTYMQQKM